MSKAGSIAALYAMAFMMSGNIGGLTSEDILSAPPRERQPPKGCKKFFIDGIEVWALNEKNARRKAAKLMPPKE